jgi:biopolymer transport protein ExbD
MAQDRVRGFSRRLIETPGYHIHPQYDLVHTRQIVFERIHKKRGFTLLLAPMVDLFSILVIYLLMNFSSSGEVFFISKDLQLPKASKGTPLQNLPLISVVGSNVLFDAEKADDGKPVSVQELNDEKVPRLRELLKHVQNIRAQIEPGKPFKGEINLQAGVNTPFDDVKKVMRVLIAEGWTGINFVVDPSR